MKTNLNQTLFLGMQFAIAVAMCVIGGYYLDKKLHTLPVFLVIGVALGSSAGFLSIYREVFPNSKHKKKDIHEPR